MKNLNLTVQITEENGSPFIKTYTPNYLYKGEVTKGLCFANKERAEEEVKLYKNLGYLFLYFENEIVFL